MSLQAVPACVGPLDKRRWRNRSWRQIQPGVQKIYEPLPLTRWPEPWRRHLPGAVQVHQATNGALVRVRLPGGMLTAAQLATLATASSRFGSGKLELTARGKVQVRGIIDTAAIAGAIGAAGLLPATGHGRPGSRREAQPGRVCIRNL